MGALTRRPAQKIAVRKSRVTTAAIKSGRRVLGIEPARRSARIDLDVCVMNRPCVARMKFESPHESASRTWHRNHKRTDDVSAVGRQCVGVRHREHEIRLAEFPRLACGGLMQILDSNAFLRA